MADRVVKVSLTAQVSNYVAGMEQARKATLASSTASQDASAKFAAQNQAMTQIGTGMVAIGALAAVGVGLAIKKFADFDEAMSFVAAATHESADNMNLLRDAALEAGARTVFSATESANAIEELGKAGLTTADILGGGLDGALSLAAAGGLGVAEAAGIAAIALKTFKLEGSDMTHVADLLAAGAGKAMGDVTDLAAALAQSGQVAASTGLSIEETTATLSAFAAQGLLGSDAGTSFKSMLQRLTPVSAESKKEMERLGISAYDVNGNFIGMEKFAGNLQESLKDLTVEQRNAALAQIFGSDAVRAATVLYSEGAAGIAKWEGSVNDAGYAAETAAMRLDNLKGDVEQLGGAFDTALIKSGSASDVALRGLVQAATSLLDIFNGAPLIVQQAALGLGVLTAGAALTGGAFLLVVPKIAEFGVALTLLSTSQMPGVATAAIRMQAAIAASGGALTRVAGFMTGPWGLAIAATVVGVALLNSALEKFYATSSEITNGLTTSATAAELWAKATQGGIADWTTGSVDSLENFQTHLDDSREMQENWFATLAHGTDGTFDFNQALGRMGDSLAGLAATDLPGAQKGFRDFAESQGLSMDESMVMLNQMPKFKEALVTQATQLGVNITSTDEAANKAALLKIAFGEVEDPAYAAADAYLAASDKAAGLDDKLQKLMKALEEANNVGRDAVTANIGYQQSLADVDEQIAKIAAGTEGYAATLDITTQAGRDNQALLVDLATANSDAALAQFTLDGDTAAYKLTLENGHQAVIDRARALGATADEAKAIADNIRGIPTETDIKVLVDTKQANDAIADTKAKLLELMGLTRSTSNSVGPLLTGYVPIGRATGGILPGAPSSKDNMFIHAASGEFVTNARSTANPANRRALEFMNNGGTINGYANGGMVRPQYVSGGGGGSNSYSTTGDTFNASFALAPVAGRSLADQAFEAARRLKIRR